MPRLLAQAALSGSTTVSTPLRGEAYELAPMLSYFAIGSMRAAKSAEVVLRSN